jgi:D-alanyl-D-alanine carboxypeptidase (penicillin-binding protein 5/6)
MIPASTYASSKSEIPPIANPEQEPKAYIVVEAQNGKIISSKNANTSLNVASTGKIVTALAAINTINRDQLIEVPPEAASVQPMRIGMKEGEVWKRDDLLYSLLLVSANDAAYALAEASAGSIAEFGQQQKRIAKELGMKHSTFGDPSGLDDSLAVNGDTKMSAYDLAIAARATLANPDLAKIVSTMSYQFTGGDNEPHTLTNHNDDFLANYAGANGMKTGYTKKSGRTLIASATRDGTTLIAVVLNVAETDAWAASLLDQGFAAISAGNVPKNAEKLPAIGVIGSKSNVTILNEPKTDSKEQAAGDKISAEESPDSGGSGNMSVGLVTFLILAALAVAFVLRRRAVMKRKRLRRLRAAQMKEMQRRSMIDVIDITTETSSELIKK